MRSRVRQAGMAAFVMAAGGAAQAAVNDGTPVPPPREAFVAAGCVITTEAGVVLGINRVLRTLQLPVGRRSGDETARQTAARETREETGIAVDVGAPLIGLANGTVRLFSCTPREPIDDFAALRPLDTVEVSEVVVLDPHSMRSHDGRLIERRWRFSETRVLLRLLYVPETR